MTFWRWVAAANVAIAIAVTVYACGKAERDRAATARRIRSEIERVIAAYTELRGCLRSQVGGETLSAVVERRFFREANAEKLLQQCGTRFTQVVRERLYVDDDGDELSEVWRHRRLQRLRSALISSRRSVGAPSNTMGVLCSAIRDVDQSLRAAVASFELSAKLPGEVRCQHSRDPGANLRLPRGLWKRSPGLLAMVRRVDRAGVLVWAQTPATTPDGGVVNRRVLARSRNGRRWELLPLPAGSWAYDWVGQVGWSVRRRSRDRAVQVYVNDHRRPGTTCDQRWIKEGDHEVCVHRRTGWKLAATLATGEEIDGLIANGTRAALITRRNSRRTLRLLDEAGNRVSEPVALGDRKAHVLFAESGAVAAVELAAEAGAVQVTSRHVPSGARTALRSTLRVPLKETKPSDYVGAKVCASKSVHWMVVEARRILASEDDGKSWRVVGTMKGDNLSLRCARGRAALLFSRDDAVWHVRCGASACETAKRLGAGHTGYFSVSEVGLVLVGDLETGYVLDVSNNAPTIEAVTILSMSASVPDVRAWRVLDHVFARSL